MRIFISELSSLGIFVLPLWAIIVGTIDQTKKAILRGIKYSGDTVVVEEKIEKTVKNLILGVSIIAVGIMSIYIII